MKWSSHTDEIMWFDGHVQSVSFYDAMGYSSDSAFLFLELYKASVKQ